MTRESKYCIAVMKGHFNKEIVMTKKDDESFKNSTKYWIFDHVYVHGDVEVRDND